MQTLEMSHSHLLVFASLGIAIMAGFTGLSLLKGASETTIDKRKFNIVLAAIAMGGGIWSMHFVAMLGLQLPIPFFYEFLSTLVSALIAILVVGIALLILHFVKRDRKTIIASGALVGIGIVVMHYLGMSGMTGAAPGYSIPSVIVITILAAGLGGATFWIAYNRRNSGNILLGAIFFGIAVFAVHFIAMLGTTFHAASAEIGDKILISNEILAIGVSITTFILCGAFLLTGISFVTPKQGQPTGASQDALKPDVAASTEKDAMHKHSENTAIQTASIRLPFEKDGRSYFLSSQDVMAIRAEGHYTFLYTKHEKLFCPHSISYIAKRLSGSAFINCHRSYLINPDHVSEFERKKDNGVCYFDSNSSLEKVPVSRSKLKTVQQALGLS